MNSKLMTFFVIVGTLVIVGSAGAQSSESVQSVEFSVSPNISVSNSNTAPVLTTPAAGTYQGVLTFDVHGNQQYVNLQVQATALYKGNTSTSLNIIPLSPTVTGADVVAELGAPIDTLPTMMPWTDPMVTSIVPNLQGVGVTQIDSGGTSSLNGMAACTTGTQTYESGQNNSFSQEVYVTCVWQNDNFELPVGQYGGYVKLTAMILP